MLMRFGLSKKMGNIMQMQPESVNTELAARKPWVEPEFEVLDAEDAQVGHSGVGSDTGIYS